MHLRAGAAFSQQLRQVQGVVLAVGQAALAGRRAGTGYQAKQRLVGVNQQAEFAQCGQQLTAGGFRHVA